MVHEQASAGGRGSVDASTWVCHRASWLFPGNGPPVEDGAVLVKGRVIAAAGTYNEILDRVPWGTYVEDHGNAVLMPALVNAHTHLELTGLEGRIPLPQPGFAAWLERLFAEKARSGGLDPAQAVEKGLGKLREGGTVLCGDVGNEVVLGAGKGEAGTPLRQVFLEVLGFHETEPEAALGPGVWKNYLEAWEDNPLLGLGAHSCYATSPELIRALWSACRSKGRPFTIHVAEHEEELEFVRSGTGYFRELLERLGKWNPSWRASGPTPLSHLDALGVLDARTLLAHAVHFTDEDWDLAAARGCAVCFCPRSNANLHTGLPAPEKALKRNVPCALGTDSLAGNTDLSLFAEGAFVLDRFPGVSPEQVALMMTAGGARALGWEHRFGALDTGRRAAVLAVDLPEGTEASKLAERMVEQGKKGAVRWACGP